MTDSAPTGESRLYKRPGFIWAALSLVVTLIFAWPARPLPELTTAPIGPALLLLLAFWIAAWYAARVLHRTPTKIEWVSIIGLLASKILLGLFLPTAGVWARVTPADSQPSQPSPTASLSPLRETRPDGYARFSNTKIPAYFINDHTRYDFYKVGQPDRHTYPTEVRAEFSLLTDEELTLVLPPGATLSGEGVQPLAQSSTSTLVRFTPPKSSRTNKLDLVTTSTAGFQGFYVWKLRNGEPVSLDSDMLWPVGERPNSSTRFTGFLLFFLGDYWCELFISLLFLIWQINTPRSLRKDSKITWSGAATITLFICMLLPISRDHLDNPAPPIIALALSIVLAVHLFRNRSDLLRPPIQQYVQATLLFCWSLLGNRFFLDRFPDGFAILDAGMDSLFHYTYAMQIVQGDWFHSFDAPFTRQPFMRYLLTIPILLLGEGPAWGFICNWILYGVIAMQLAAVLRPYSILRAWIIFLLWFPFLVISPFRIWVPTLFPEVSSIVFLMASFLLLVSPARPYGTGRLIGAGILFGLAVWTRNNLLLALPFWVLAVLFRWPEKSTRLAWKAAMMLGATVTAMVLVITLRNKLLAPEAPLSLLLRPDMSAIALFQGFLPDQLPGGGHLGPPTGDGLAPDYKAMFFTAVRENPGLFLKYQLDRLSVLLGGPSFWDPNLVQHYPRWNPIHLALWGTVLITLFRRRLQGIVSMPHALCWGVLISQAALLIFTGFVGEGYRFVVPFYPFLLLLCFLPVVPKNTTN